MVLRDLQIDRGYVNLVFMFVKIVVITSCSRWFRVLALERRVNNNESRFVVLRLAFFKLVSSMWTEDLSTFIGRVVYVPWTIILVMKRELVIWTVTNNLVLLCRDCYPSAVAANCIWCTWDYVIGAIVTRL
jgi:hypothetical protein